MVGPSQAVNGMAEALGKSRTGKVLPRAMLVLAVAESTRGLLSDKALKEPYSADFLGGPVVRLHASIAGVIGSIPG